MKKVDIFASKWLKCLLPFLNRDKTKNIVIISVFVFLCVNSECNVWFSNLEKGKVRIGLVSV